jgi:hypothetical protein
MKAKDSLEARFCFSALHYHLQNCYVHPGLNPACVSHLESVGNDANTIRQGVMAKRVIQTANGRPKWPAQMAHQRAALPSGGDPISIALCARWKGAHLSGFRVVEVPLQQSFSISSSSSPPLPHQDQGAEKRKLGNGPKALVAAHAGRPSFAYDDVPVFPRCCAHFLSHQCPFAAMSSGNRQFFLPGAFDLLPTLLHAPNSSATRYFRNPPSHWTSASDSPEHHLWLAELSNFSIGDLCKNFRRIKEQPVSGKLLEMMEQKLQDKDARHAMYVPPRSIPSLLTDIPLTILYG